MYNKLSKLSNIPWEFYRMSTFFTLFLTFANHFNILGAECNLAYRFPNNHNRTALHAACNHGNLMLVYLLLQAGVDPNVVDNKMKSPIRMAAKSGHSNVIQYLMNFNGAPEIKVLRMIFFFLILKLYIIYVLLSIVLF